MEANKHYLDQSFYLKYIVPKEGANFWIDSLVIPKGTKNKSAAETFINFLCEKDSAYRVAEEIGYTTPHEGAMMEQDEEVRNNPGAYMPEEIIYVFFIYFVLKFIKIKYLIHSAYPPKHHLLFIIYQLYSLYYST